MTKPSIKDLGLFAVGPAALALAILALATSATWLTPAAQYELDNGPIGMLIGIIGSAVVLLAMRFSWEHARRFYGRER